MEKKGKLRRGNYQINDMREFLIVNEPTEGLLNTINERDPQQSTLFRTLKKYVTWNLKNQNAFCRAILEARC